MAASQCDAAVLGVADVAAAHRVCLFDAAQNRVVALVLLEHEVGALAVVSPEVSDPVLTEDLLAEPEAPGVTVALARPFFSLPHDSVRVVGLSEDGRRQCGESEGDGLGVASHHGQS